MIKYLLNSWLVIIWLVGISVATAEELPTEQVRIGVQLSAADQDFSTANQAQNRGDLMTAMTLFQRAADSGHAGAQASYAAILQRGQAVEDALKYYRLSAAQGDRDGQYGLGMLYFLGEGVPKNLTEARQWFERAAVQEHVYAANMMADAYISGRMDLSVAERQSVAALPWIQRAAGYDYVPALDALADAYRFGQYGLAVDAEQADKLAARASKVRGKPLAAEKKRSRLYKFFKGDSE